MGTKPETRAAVKYERLQREAMETVIAALVKKLGGSVLVTEDEIMKAMDPTITTHDHRRGFVIEAQIDD